MSQSLDSLFNSSNILINDIQEVLFPRLESTIQIGDQNNALTVESDIESKLKQIETNCDKMDIYVNKCGPNDRPQQKMRLDQLRYDSRHLLSSLRNLHHRRVQREREEREREELLTRRFTTNTETNIAMDNYFQDENSRLNSFHSNLDDMISSGSSILSGLRDQRGVLKGAQKRLIDIGNTLGLSNTVMRLIEKRGKGDKYILFGGMIVFTILMLLIWKYLT
ncbi:Golgi SNAP receptor complex member 2-like [Oppia nitens]|uniref:Golgi SNAP receptor complex member 2-like n=1 Tax=Oppia nitens TaxID=1686743 RepID=UPI0023DB436E|nr:Golgi SNAP receptor complex member 2-like [Oppia nitens]